MSELQQLIARWNSGDGKPYKGELIDWSAYDPDNFNIGCMCAQGQVLHSVGGWTPKRLKDTKQAEADTETARLLNISRAHAILLRNVNDSVDGAPAIVLTDPGKVLGAEWPKLLDFWWHMDQMDSGQWATTAGGAGGATWGAARDAARDATWGAARADHGDAASDAARAAAREIQGAHIFRAANRPFYFLPLFGFPSPDEIPDRPANYGEQSA